MKRFIVVIGTLLLAAVSVAQDVSQSIEVRVVNVDVVVRDHAGKPVTGLTKADFEIYENGQKREITNLYEVRPTAAPPKSAANASPEVVTAPATTAPEPAVEIRPRNIVMFVDNYSLHLFRRDKVLQSLRKFVDEQLRPQDLVMLVLSTQQTKVITPFTNDRKAIFDGIDAMKKIVTSGENRVLSLERMKSAVLEFIEDAKSGRLSFNDYYRESLGIVDAFVEDEILSAKNTLAALGQTAAALGGVEGKNVLIFAGAHLPEHPGAETYQWLYNAFLPYLPRLTLSTEALSGKSGSMQRYSIEEAARQARKQRDALHHRRRGYARFDQRRKRNSDRQGGAVRRLRQHSHGVSNAGPHQRRHGSETLTISTPHSRPSLPISTRTTPSASALRTPRTPPRARSS